MIVAPCEQLSEKLQNGRAFSFSSLFSGGGGFLDTLLLALLWLLGLRCLQLDAVDLLNHERTGDSAVKMGVLKIKKRVHLPVFDLASGEDATVWAGNSAGGSAETSEDGRASDLNSSHFGSEGVLCEVLDCKFATRGP